MLKFVSIFILSISNLFAATTASITLSGTVPQVISVVVAPQTGYNNLDLTTTTNNLVVANIIEQSNVTTGYSVTVSSTNSGQLKNGTVGQVTYTAKYNNVSFNLTSTPVTITNVTSQTTPANPTKPLSISYTGVAASSLMNGSYSDTLTFTITAN